MKISREEKVKEAVKRMYSLDIFKQAISLFEQEGRVMSSERPFGALYDVNEAQKKVIKEFEEKYNGLVYMVVYSNTKMGEMDSLLYVSDHKEEWGFEDEGIKHGEIFTYTHNRTTPYFSEFGSIGIKKVGGGLIRTA